MRPSDNGGGRSELVVFGCGSGKKEGGVKLKDWGLGFKKDHEKGAKLGVGDNGGQESDQGVMG